MKNYSRKCAYNCDIQHSTNQLWQSPQLRCCPLGTDSLHHYFAISTQQSDGIAEFAGLENDRLENGGVEQEQTYILHTMKWTQTNVYDA